MLRSMNELEKLNLICLLYDVIRGYTFELGREAQRGIKFYANRADTQLALLQKQFDRIIPDEAAQFGDDSDRLRAAIEKFVLESKRKSLKLDV